MAIAEMSKLGLIAMSYEKDKILDALQRTGLGEIKLHKEIPDTVIPEANAEEFSAEYALLDNALNILCAEIEAYEKEKNVKESVLKDGFDVSYSEFTGAKKDGEYSREISTKIGDLAREKTAIKGSLQTLEREEKALFAYSELETPFVYYLDTKTTFVRLGTVQKNKAEEFLVRFGETEGCAIEKLSEKDDSTVFVAVYLKDERENAENLFSAYGFSVCPFEGDISGKESYERNGKARSAAFEKLKENAEKFYGLSSELRRMKIRLDYLTFCLEKAEASSSMRATERTVWIEAYVPKDAQNRVLQEIEETGATYYAEYSELEKDEIPPTLMKNNSVVGSFETITNMYSPPSSKEVDPTLLMGIFYSVFLGFIMGDIGYGVLMFLGGGGLWLKLKRDSGLKRLSCVFALGGICAVIWGVLFNSCLGLPIFGKAIMPDPQNDNWKFVGINVPSVLILSLLLGIAQLCAGYFLKAVQQWRRGNFFDGVCDGLFWSLFSVGVALAIVGFTEEARVPILKTVGGVLAGGSLLLAMLTAGRHEKLFGKFTKGFGSAYGVINYASDILSYARLYGLMLSGVVIAQIISDFSVNTLILSGNAIFIVLGVLLMVLGHGFNLAIGLLGAYIHDARLQYVEFYGKFFEGEGELFAPLGSKHKYIYLLPCEGKSE